MLTLKAFYSSPRPYWSSAEVKAWHCETDFGNPSGHSMLSIGFAITISYKKPTCYKVAFISIAILIGFSRLVLGAHSLN